MESSDWLVVLCRCVVAAKNAMSQLRAPSLSAVSSWVQPVYKLRSDTKCDYDRTRALPR